jgi:hypothetical protein
MNRIPAFYLKISQHCIDQLGIAAEASDRSVDTLLSLTRGYGKAKVEQAFLRWATANKNKRTKWPVSDFCQQAVGILSGQIRLEQHPELDPLNATLAELGPPFTGDEYYFLSDLLEKNAADMILEAYRLFIRGMDDYQLQRAPRAFSLGGAAAMLERVRKLKAEKENQQSEQQQAEASERERVKTMFQRTAPDEDVPTEDL